MNSFILENNDDIFDQSSHILLSSSPMEVFRDVESLLNIIDFEYENSKLKYDLIVKDLQIMFLKQKIKRRKKYKLGHIMWEKFMATF